MGRGARPACMTGRLGGRTRTASQGLQKAASASAEAARTAGERVRQQASQVGRTALRADSYARPSAQADLHRVQPGAAVSEWLCLGSSIRHCYCCTAPVSAVHNSTLPC